MKRKWEIENKELMQKCVDEILQRIKDQEDMDFGYIAASDIITIVSEHLGPEIYNKALRDVQKVVENKLADIEIDIDALKQRRN